MHIVLINSKSDSEFLFVCFAADPDPDTSVIDVSTKFYRLELNQVL